MRGLLAIPLAALAACSAPAGVTADWAAVSTEAAAATVALPPETRAAAERLLAAPDPAHAATPPVPDGPAWRVGDRLLYGVSVAHADDEHHWLLELRVADVPRAAFGAGESGVPLVLRHFGGTATWDGEERPIRVVSAMIDLEVRLFDASGAPLGARVSAVPEAFLREGFHGISAVSHAWVRDGAPAELPEVERTRFAESGLRAILGLLTLFDTLQRNPDLEPILRSVVRRPPLAALLSFSRTLNLAPDLFATEPAPPVRLGGGLERSAYFLPVGLTYAGHPVLACRFTVVEPGALLRCGAGVVAIEARRPGHDHPRMSLRLLGARRGAGPALPDSSLNPTG